MDRTVRQVAVPDDARGLSTLPQIDYADAFVVETGPTRERTPEQWLRAILEDAPARTQRGLRLGWSLLGIRLGPSGSTRFVLGWEVRRSTPDHVLVRAHSRTRVSAELLWRPAEET